MSLYYVILTHSFIFNKKNIIFLYFFTGYQSHCWFWSELSTLADLLVGSPPTDLLSRISSDGSSQLDLLQRIFSVGTPSADLLRWISSCGSSQSDLLRRIFSVGSPPRDLLGRISSVRSPLADLLSEISSGRSSSVDFLSRIFSNSPLSDHINSIVEHLGVALPSASDMIKYTFITSLVHIT